MQACYVISETIVTPMMSFDSHLFFFQMCWFLTLLKNLSPTDIIRMNFEKANRHFNKRYNGNLRSNFYVVKARIRNERLLAVFLRVVDFRVKLPDNLAILANFLTLFGTE